MINTLTIKNFKSVKELQINCRKINLFIGEPNTGKSNILEALGVLSWSGVINVPLKDFVRFKSVQNLFYDDLVEEPVEITIDKRSMSIELRGDEMFYFIHPMIDKAGIASEKQICILDYSGETKTNTLTHTQSQSDFVFLRFYRFHKQDNYTEKLQTHLLPPHGSNMFSLVYGSKDLREIMATFFKTFGFNLVLRPQDRAFEFQKQVEDLVISYPYVLSSDTLQRIIFHVIAMESSKGSVLVFEEPESYAFPYYTKYLGEKIAFDETNQYFISTHNPYILSSIIEKAGKGDVNVFVTSYQDYKTKIKCLDEQELEELTGYDPFFNLSLFTQERNEQ